MTVDVVALTKARSMLIILLASCNQTLLAFDAIGNVLDDGLADDLRRVIARSEDELAKLTAALDELRNG